jgi:ABC-2 type transport system permease protein
LSGLGVVLWKELREMVRDRRTLAMVVLTPVLTMSFMGVVAVYLPTVHEVVISLVDEDYGEATLGSYLVSSSGLIEVVRNFVSSHGYVAVLGDDPAAHVVLKLPKGFVRNLTSFDSQASVVLVKRLGSPRVDEAANYVEAVLGYISGTVARAKVEVLGEAAGVEVNAEAVLNPIVVRTLVVTPGGAPAGVGEELRAYLGRLLALSLVFVTTPAASYIADSLVGEKERKTLEKVLATPIGRNSFILGKVVAASVVGLIGGSSSAVGGLLLYLLPVLTRSLDTVRYLTPELVAVLFASSYLSVLSSLAISLPAVLRSPSVRAASILSASIIGIASVTYFAALFVNLDELKPPASAVLAVPYASLASAVVRVALGEYLKALAYVAYPAALSLALVWVSTKLLDPERMVTHR